MAWAVAVQPDGKIVVDGAADLDFALARYTIDGTLDDEFGDSGRVAVDLGGDDQINAPAIQSDGKIMCAGVADGIDFALVPLDVSGRPDETFGVRRHCPLREKPGSVGHQF